MNDRIEMLELDMEPTTALAEQPQARSVVPASQSHDDFMYLAMQRGFSPEQIGQMMDLRDRQFRHVTMTEFRKDFAGFRGENIIVPKTKNVDRGKAGSFVQAEYHVAANMLSPALSRHGFGVRHDEKFGSRKWVGDDGIERDIPWVYVTCFLEHRSGHSERLDLEGPPGELSANTPTQNMQVTASYLKRQSLLAITGTATGGEDDENKMRGAAADSGEADPVLQEGRDASMMGMKQLTAWWGKLDNKQRSKWSDEFGAMRKVAAEADKRDERAAP